MKAYPPGLLYTETPLNLALDEVPIVYDPVFNLQVRNAHVLQS